MQPKRRVATEEARSGLYRLVRELAEVDTPASTLLERAVGIDLSPHGAWPDVMSEAGRGVLPLP